MPFLQDKGEGLSPWALLTFGRGHSSQRGQPVRGRCLAPGAAVLPLSQQRAPEGRGRRRGPARARARARLGPGWVAAWAARLLGPPPPAGDAARLRPGERRPPSPRVPVLPPACGHWPSLMARDVNWSLLETTDRTPVDTACLCTCACLCVPRGVPVRAARAPLCATGVPACTPWSGCRKSPPPAEAGQQGRVACRVGGCRAEPPPATRTARKGWILLCQRLPAFSNCHEPCGCRPVVQARTMRHRHLQGLPPAPWRTPRLWVS